MSVRRTPTEPSAPPPQGAAGGPPADESTSSDDESGVTGERGIPSVNRVRSVQSRVTSVLAVIAHGRARRGAPDLVLLGRDPPQRPSASARRGGDPTPRARASRRSPR